MDLKSHVQVFKDLLQEYCLFLVDITFVDSVSDWCRQQGIEEPDKERPLRLIADEKKGCKLVIREFMSDKALEDRIKAMGVRSALQNVASDRVAMLNSDKKKLAYLFLSEYASTLPDLEGDELLADNWAFDELERLNFFRE